MSAVVSPSTGPSRWHRLWAWMKGPPIPKEKRWTPTYVINLVCISAIMMILCLQGLMDTWRLGLTFAEVKCLDGTGYLIHNSHPGLPVKGDIYAYRSHGLQPLLRDGSPVIKIAAALPGDVVRVDASGVYINGVKWGDLNPITLSRTHRTVASVTRTFTVQSGEVLMLGNLPRSYDGRYWGPIKESQLIGHAWRLW